MRCDIETGERLVITGDCPKYNCETVHINFLSVRLTENNLWCHKSQATGVACHLVYLIILGSLANAATQAEVEQFEGPIGSKPQIFGL